MSVKAETPDQKVEVTGTEPTIPVDQGLKVEWLADLKGLLKLRKYLLAKNWEIPLSLVSDEGGRAPVNVTQQGGGGNFLKGAFAAGAAMLAGGLVVGALALLLNRDPPAPPPKIPKLDVQADLEIDPPP